MKEVFEYVKQKARYSKDFIILVVDEHCQKIISSFCSVYDLIEYASIYQIEKLQKQRKRYPMSDVIYFIDPTNE